MKVFLVVLLVVLIILGYSAYSFMRKVSVSRTLVEEAVPYSLVSTSTDPREVSLLVLGDSTAVGVGADSANDTLAALLSQKVGATRVDNFAISGARVKDLSKEIERIRREKYTYILIGIGANDVIRFGNADNTAKHLGVLLAGLPLHTHLIVYMAGNVGGSQLFPKVLNPQYTERSLAFHAAFAPVVATAGGVYVNLYTDPGSDPFIVDPKTYFAADGLHPSSAGYKKWFERIGAALDG